jgi:hypothetical protein
LALWDHIGAEAWDHTDHLVQWAHVQDRVELAPHVSECELSLLDLLDHVLLLISTHGFIDSFHQTCHIAHAQETLDEASSIERLEVLKVLTCTQEDNRTLGGCHGAEGTTALCVAV